MISRIKKWFKVHFYETNPEWKFLKFNCGDRLNPIFYKEENDCVIIRGTYMGCQITYATSNYNSQIIQVRIKTPYLEKQVYYLDKYELHEVNRNRWRWNYNYDFAAIIKYSKIYNTIETKYHNEVITNYCNGDKK